MYKLLIADDESIIRKGIKALLNLSELKITEVLEAEDGQEAVRLASAHHPDIVLMDINMPELDGLTAASRIKQEQENVFIIMLTGYDYFEYTQKAIRAKVDDYILKPVSREDITHILKSTVDKLGKLKKQRELSSLSGGGDSFSLNDSFAAIQEYIENHIYDSELSLAGMSEEIGYSSNYLSQLIKQRHAMPFQDYINRRRMERAKLLLLSTELKNHEIAEAVGMEDVNYFITKFKKFAGVTPKQYRKGV